jgi:hypothetical protein
MNLAHTGNTHFPGPESGKKLFAILENAVACVPLREPEVQNLLSGFPPVAEQLERACATHPRAESMNQPVELRERRSFEDLQAAAWAKIPRSRLAIRIGARGCGFAGCAFISCC